MSNGITSLGIGDYDLNSSDFQRILDVSGYASTLTVDEVLAKLEADYPAADYPAGQSVIVNGTTYYTGLSGAAAAWLVSTEGSGLSDLEQVVYGKPCSLVVIQYPNATEQAQANIDLTSVEQIPYDAAVGTIYRINGTFYKVEATGAIGYGEVHERLAAEIDALEARDASLASEYAAADDALAGRIDDADASILAIAQDLDQAVSDSEQADINLQAAISAANASILAINASVVELLAKTPKDVSAVKADSQDLVSLTVSADSNYVWIGADNSALISKISNINTSLAAAQSKIDEIDSTYDPAAIDASFAALGASAAANASAIAEGIAAANASIESANGAIAAVTSDASKLDEAIAALEEAFDENAGAVNASLAAANSSLEALAESITSTNTIAEAAASAASTANASIASLAQAIESLSSSASDSTEAVNASITSMMATSGVISSRVESLDASLSSLQESTSSSLADVSAGVQNASARLATLEELPEAVETLEDRMVAAEAADASLNAKLIALDAKMGVAEMAIDDINTSISDIKDVISAIAEDLDAAEAGVEANKLAVEALEAGAATANASINSIESSLAAAQVSITDINASAQALTAIAAAHDTSIAELAQAAADNASAISAAQAGLNASIAELTAATEESISNLDSGIAARIEGVDASVCDMMQTAADNAASIGALTAKVESGLVESESPYVEIAEAGPKARAAGAAYTISTDALDEKIASIEASVSANAEDIADINLAIYGDPDHVKDITLTATKSQKSAAIEIDDAARIPINASAGSIYVIIGDESDTFYEVQATGTFGINQAINTLQDQVASLEAERADSTVEAHPDAQYITVDEVPQDGYAKYVINDQGLREKIEEIEEELGKEVDPSVPDYIIQDLYGNADHVVPYKNPDEAVREEAVANYAIESVDDIPYTAPEGRVYAISEINPDTSLVNYSFVQVSTGGFGIVKGVEYLAGKIDEVTEELNKTEQLENRLYGTLPEWEYVTGFTPEQDAIAQNIDGYDNPALYSAVEGDCFRVLKDGRYEHIVITVDGSIGTFHAYDASMNAMNAHLDASLAEIAQATADAISDVSARLGAELEDLSVSAFEAIGNISTNLNGRLAAAEEQHADDTSMLKAMIDDVSAYQSYLEDATATTVALGDIPAGTTAAELEAMTVHEILTRMLFKDYQPTHTLPSLAITYPPDGQVIECGSTIYLLKDATQHGRVVCVSEDGAVWNDGMSKPYTVWEDSKYTANGQPIDTPFTPTDPKGYKIKCTKQFAVNADAWKGMTSQGHDAAVPAISPLRATSQEITIHVAYPLYCNGAWTSTENAVPEIPPAEAKMSSKLLTKDAEIAIVFAPQSKTGQAYEIYLPEHLKVAGAVQQNEASGLWDATVALNPFAEVPGTEGGIAVSVIGGTATYRIWRSSDPLAGSAKIKLTIADRGTSGDGQGAAESDSVWESGWPTND